MKNLKLCKGNIKRRKLMLKSEVYERVANVISELNSFPEKINKT